VNTCKCDCPRSLALSLAQFTTSLSLARSPDAAPLWPILLSAPRSLLEVFPRSQGKYCPTPKADIAYNTMSTRDVMP